MFLVFLIKVKFFSMSVPSYLSVDTLRRYCEDEILTTASCDFMGFSDFVSLVYEQYVRFLKPSSKSNRSSNVSSLAKVKLQVDATSSVFQA